MAPSKGDSRAGVELAYEHIRSAIVEGRYEPSQRLIEQQIAEEFNVSRTPIREAIRRLEAEGLVITEHHRGAMVRPVSANEILDLYELRARLESYAAELAASRIRPDEVEVLEAAVNAFSDVAAMSGASDMEKVRALTSANSDIHSLIVEGAHHVQLAAMLRRAVDIPLVFQAFQSFDASQLERSDFFHRLIFKAISRGDAARAARLMHEHISEGLDVLLVRLDAADLEPPISQLG